MKNLIGKRFGMLVVRSLIRNPRRWECVCDCGGITICTTSNLTGGNSQSCGCQKGKVLQTHGRSKHPTYKHWRNMIHRCTNPNSADFQRYGGAGITVDDSWKDIETFIVDMGIPPSNMHTLDRINSALGYSKNNCRWATRKEQARNRKNTLFIINKIPLAQWCEENSIDYNLALRRFHAGFTPEEIINTPTMKKYDKGQLCAKQGCTGKVKTKGLCNKHYLQMWNKNKKEN